MTMTTAGRIALFVNLALSLVFAFWGVGIYSQRINWTAEKSGERVGEYAKRAEVIRRLQESRGRVEARWSQALLKSPREVLGVLLLEAQRPKWQDWYRQKLEILRTGQPIKALEYEMGQLKFDAKTGQPSMKEVPELKNLRVLNDDYIDKQAQTVKATQDIENLVQEEKTLTEQLGDGKLKGLRFDLAQQQLAERQSLDEQEYLHPLLYNSMVEQQSLEDRNRILEDRLKRLQSLSVAKQP